ncbi:MAG: hypothetical protein MJ179_01300 [Treponema sp.]|nr:hypothetical protein [Treponema sp.]
MKDIYIVGLNIGNHDSSACLLKNGEIVSYIEQERISRNKLAIGEAPIDALKCCLEKEGISLREVEAVAVGMDWTYRKAIYNEPKEESDKYLRFNDPDWFLPKEVFGPKRPDIHVVRHHYAHAASAYRVSGFDECAILVVDNRGEDASTSLGYAKNGEITFFKQINIQNSLGVFYNRACRYTGLYGKYREVGKFMGLASYGTPNITIPLRPSRDAKLFKDLSDIEDLPVYDSLQKRTEQLNEYFRKNCFPFEDGNSDEIMSYANFAASAQNSLESVLIDFVSELKERTGLDNLVMAGGVTLNCSANGKIEQSGLFKNIYVPPFASDAGTAIGAALETYYKLHGKVRTNQVLHSASLGLSYTNDAIILELNKYENKISYKKLEDDTLYCEVANLISKGNIVAWMQGDFEAGPRALGNRSILADPRSRKSLIKLNNIKQREMWRPIAPSILVDYYSDFFEGQPENKFFMNVATKVKKEKQNSVPAIVHVDETARPQIVTKDNEKYYKLVNAFYKETGIPVICNTSFNLRGVPLVNTPENAIDCFLNSELDFLVMGNVLVQKKER